ncbi:MAG: hypothetical protein KAG20_10695 [Cocleimonas sp.]|nr:hypothetical protein [Cocleimonas sp.]
MTKKTKNKIYNTLFIIPILLLIIGLHPIVKGEGNQTSTKLEVTLGLVFSPVFSYTKNKSIEEESTSDININIRSWSFLSILIAILLLTYRYKKSSP